MKDKLEEIFRLQKELRLKIGGGKDVLQNLNERDRGKWTCQYIDCISNELEELRNCFAWKHWSKEYKEGKQFHSIDMQNIPVEIVDILHFCFDLCFIHGIDAKQLFELYRKKQKINLARQDNEYSQSNKTEDDNKNVV